VHDHILHDQSVKAGRYREDVRRTRPPKLDDHLCFALYDASRAFVRAYGPLLGELGLTYPQYLALLVLWETDRPVSVGELGNRLHLDSGTLTPLLKRLEQAGLVDRRRDDTDERRVLVHLTPTGSALRKPAARIPECLSERLDIDRDRAIELRDQLIQLTAILTSTAANPLPQSTSSCR
jgi:DNA-binding MarR family transcriptional regulator